MITIRQFDQFRWRVITPTDWGHDVSEPMTLNESLNNAIGSQPISLSPPQKLGESKREDEIRWTSIEKSRCAVLGCANKARFKAQIAYNTEYSLNWAEIEPNKVVIDFHNLCPSCLVVWVQEVKKCE